MCVRLDVGERVKANLTIVFILLLLTTIVLIYDYQYNNPPQTAYLNAYRTTPSEDYVTQFYLTLPSKGIPHVFINATEDTSFRMRVMDYLQASNVLREPVEVSTFSVITQDLKTVSDSPVGFDADVEFFNETYFMQVRYLTAYDKTSFETTIYYGVNMIAAAAYAVGLFGVLNDHFRKRVDVY
jgi:hypothetical protein